MAPNVARAIGSMLRRRRPAAPVAPATPARGRQQGPPREATDRPTHVGAIFDAAVTRVRARMSPAGLDADHDLAHEHFQLPHFLLQARHLLESGRGDALGHFLDNGAAAKASPEVNFDMRAYLARHPERAGGPESPYLAWLKDGRGRGEIADPAPGLERMAPVLGRDPAELAEVLADTRTDLQERLLHGTLGEMISRAAEVEPLIGELWSSTTRVGVPPFVSEATTQQVAALHACHRASDDSPARLLLVCTEPRWGGGRRVEGHIAHALAGSIEPSEIVVLYTDASGRAPAGRFPEGVREVDLAAEVDGMEDAAAQRTLVELIRSYRADSVVNVNSRLLYDAMTTHGKALAASERLFIMLFCNEQLALGNWVGLPLRQFYRVFDLVAGVLTDSEHLADWLCERHQLHTVGRDRIHVLRAPVDPATPIAPAHEAADGRRPQVFWAGRWDRQKRIGIALEVARRMPEVDLRMWGEPVLTGAPMGRLPDNVRLEGRYDHIWDLDLAEADAWLYTSGWDGVPSQLLEVAMTGVPLVASLVGGTGEVVEEQDAWPVREAEDPTAYVDALHEVLADPAAARTRAEALRKRMMRERTEEAYAADVARLLLTSEDDAR